MKKKVVSMALIFTMLMSSLILLTGCGDSDGGKSSSKKYSKNIEKVRSSQTILLADYDLTFGEVMESVLKDVKWKDTTYKGKKAVMLQGTNKEDKEKIEAMFYIEDDDVSEAYFKRDDTYSDSVYLYAGLYVTQVYYDKKGK